MKKENRTIYTVKEKVQETPDVVTLKLLCDDGIPSYYAGQFLTVFFEDIGNAEGKSYTISSEPFEETLNLTVKGVGKFSNKLCNMKVGDTLEASLPYGYFYSESETSTLIMIAGGIGVTPFRSIIVDSLKKYPTRQISLYYSNKNIIDMVFRNEFEKLEKEFSVFSVKNYVTQESFISEGIREGRIKASDVLEETKDFKNKEFFICGSIPFVRDFWKSLKEAGVSEETIYTEAFF